MFGKQPKQDTMNMFSKNKNNIKNTVPLTLQMVKQIDPNNRVIQGVLQVYKVINVAKIIGLNIKAGGKIQIEVADNSSGQDKSLIHLFRPQHAADQLDLNQGQTYKFISILKQDHGQLVLNCVKFKKIIDQRQIEFHQKSIEMAQLSREMLAKQLQNKDEQWE